MEDGDFRIITNGHTYRVQKYYGDSECWLTERAAVSLEAAKELKEELIERERIANLPWEVVG